MKYLRVSARIDPDRAPEFLRLLADSPDVQETRVLDWNRAESVSTVLYAIDGDIESFRASATDTPGIDSVEVTATEQNPSYVLVEARPLAIPVFDSVFQVLSRSGMVVRKPIIYRDCKVFGRIVGRSEPVEAALESAPNAFDLRVDEIRTYRGDPKRPEVALSDRQREAVEAALRLDYYDQPRGATHEDIADELGCAPATASDHLQKAERKIMSAVVDSFGPSV
ncbi:helix-turn-helix domain-containing protein [Halorussus lipolyticus]|uniref:helix-turn-helix domain-containing protein n=1 Tax=Halorussus lipolyticus TaxID=3034024 RepID=UPI0023E87EA6|nr:helix-turn-helix domain-containing protein [Halorussus sp. DT80]